LRIDKYLHSVEHRWYMGSSTERYDGRRISIRGAQLEHRFLWRGE